MNLLIIVKSFFVLVIVLTVLPPLQVFSQEKISTQEKLTPIELAIQELASAVKSATNQEDLAKKVFDAMPNFEYNAGFFFSTVSPISLILKDQPEFKNVLDFVEGKWLSFPINDYYDEVGLFLLWGNIIAGRFDKADALFTKMKENLPGKSIDPYFETNSLMEGIYKISFCREPFTTREDLSLFYAAKMVAQMYEYQGRQDKFWEVIELIINNYKDTKGAELFNTFYEARKAELRYKGVSFESISEEEIKQLNQLKDNAIMAREEMNKICGGVIEK